MSSTHIDLEAYRRLEDELRTLKQQFEALINNSTVAFLVIDLTGHILRVNDTFEHTFGWTQEEAIGLYLPFVPAQHRLLFEKSLGDPNFFGIASEEVRVRKDGTQFVASETVTPIHNEHGEVTSYACILRDITERKASELRLNVSEQRYKSLFENNPNAIYSVDRLGRFTEVNPAVEKISGYKPEELLYRDHSELLLPEYVNVSFENLHSSKPGERKETEASFIHKNGHRVDLSVISLPIEVDGELVGMYCISQDITERKHTERMINRMAFTDCLTDLPNRRLFKQRLVEGITEAKAQNEQLAVLFIDLDRFKIINDSLGHAFGDHVLQAVAERLKSCIGPQDTLSRMGGDEFTLLLPNLTGLEHVMTVSQRILQIVREPMVIEGNEIHVTTSIGIALYPDNGLDADTLMKNADIAMYRIKVRGKNNYQFYSDVMNEDAVQNLHLEGELRKALERDEFVLHYQPQVNVATGQITGMEALIRWQHPERGLLSPFHFISLAEETGLIVPIGEWVLRKACQDGRRWMEKAGRLPMRMAVNLSLIQFQEPRLVETIQSILEETGLEPRYLELEITESIAMHNVEQVVAKLEQLVNLGVQISIDDFGTGFSSLSYLKKFPIHKLKIDRSFITDITSDPDDASIVSAIIAMANSLKLNLIVEGVETEDQQSYLHRLGCFEMQGYLFSRPLPVTLLDQLLEQWV